MEDSIVRLWSGSLLPKMLRLLVGSRPCRDFSIGYGEHGREHGLAWRLKRGENGIFD